MVGYVEDAYTPATNNNTTINYNFYSVSEAGGEPGEFKFGQLQLRSVGRPVKLVLGLPTSAAARPL